MTATTGARLIQIDGLRGVAVLMVVIFHYTTRYEQRFGHAMPLPFDGAFGHLGVQLFFVISGFVIRMTLDRCRHPMDFLVSRFSRLFPTFWASLLLTSVALTVGGAPGTGPALSQVAWNATMVPGLLAVRPVDGAYWSLEVELCFYLVMLIFTALGRVGPGSGWLQVWLLIAGAAQLMPLWAGRPAPYVAGVVLVLKWIPWFALGIVAHDLRTGQPKGWAHAVMAAMLAIVTVALEGGWLMAAFAVACFLAIRLASLGRLQLLEVRALAWLGAVSYPLYLTHQELGMASIRRLQAAGVTAPLSVAITIAGALTLAAALHHAVEKPAMRALRAAWRRRAAKWPGDPGLGPVAAWPRAAAASGMALLMLGSVASWLLRSERANSPDPRNLPAADRTAEAAQGQARPVRPRTLP